MQHRQNAAVSGNYPISVVTAGSGEPEISLPLFSSTFPPAPLSPSSLLLPEPLPELKPLAAHPQPIPGEGAQGARQWSRAALEPAEGRGQLHLHQPPGPPRPPLGRRFPAQLQGYPLLELAGSQFNPSWVTKGCEGIVKSPVQPPEWGTGTPLGLVYPLPRHAPGTHTA